MATINVANLSAFLESYFASQVKKQNPNIDTSQDSVFFDLFIKPLSSVARPLVDIVNKVDLMSNLANADEISVEDMDSIGVNNYLIERNNGTRATAVVTLLFGKIPETGNLVIPAGTTFATSGGLQYIANSSSSYSQEELESLYNSSTLTYDIDVACTAAGVGTAYRVSSGQITSLISTFANSNFVSSVTNNAPVTDGTDTESNARYASRIKQYYVSQHLGTAPGYINDSMNLCQEIQDIVVVGKDDARMTRDVITAIKDSSAATSIHIDAGDYTVAQIATLLTENDAAKSLHFGGKTDIYLKGCIYHTLSITCPLNTPVLRLSEDYADITVANISVINNTDSNKVVAFTVSEASDGACIITITNASDVSYDPNIVSEMNVTYDINGETIQEYFNVGISQYELTSPVKELINVVNSEFPDISISSALYELIHKDASGDIITAASPIHGTTQEKTYLHFMSGTETLENGTTMIATYSANQTLVNLREYYNLQENRITTNDILFREANINYINISIEIRMKDQYTLDSTKTANILNSISQYMKSLPIGASVYESDIVDWLCNDSNVNSFLKAISLPFTAFYIPVDISADISNTRSGTVITCDSITYPALNKLQVTVATT